MQGCFSLLLHAHLPFVRHPEHERFLEEHWLFEAVVETYLPLLQLLQAWQRDGVRSGLTLTLSPTLCSMLQDRLLQDRCLRHLDQLLTLAEKETRRTLWEKPFHRVAEFYGRRLAGLRDFYLASGRDLVGLFRILQDVGQLEIITTAATHAVLPLLAQHRPSLRGQILAARDHYRQCFGRNPRGIWLPECAYVQAVEPILCEAGLRWFVLDSHGILNSEPRPRYALYAPLVTPSGLAAFGRDLDSAKQVWSRDAGYPGDPRYRDFYRDIGHDLDLDYLEPHLPTPGRRGFTGFKYHRITGGTGPKEVYDREAAVQAADQHAAHFLAARVEQFQKLTALLERPPVLLAPYDAELFGHWWYEGPEFLDFFVRKAFFDQQVFELGTPQEFLRRCPTHQLAAPAASSWGEDGYWRVWLNEKNQWIYPHLHAAQERMSELVARHPEPEPMAERALRQAARELLLAQASDWPFILRTGTSPDYARRRVQQHLRRFTTLYEQLTQARLDEPWLHAIEAQDNIFPEIDYRYWAASSSSPKSE
jgi:1,4-alpha-glucan branching enzyme